MSNTVKLKSYNDVQEEFVANATITPGMLIELMSTEKVRVHATAGGNVIPMFALEDELQGDGIDDNYTANDQVQVWIPTRGDQVNAIVHDGETIVIGDFLESAGNGKLRKHGTDSTGDYYFPIVGMAMAAVDMSGSSGEDPDGRIAVMIL